MKHVLNNKQKRALGWLFIQSGPVFSFASNDPCITTIHELMKIKLAKRQKIVRHPHNEDIQVSCFSITRKGKRYHGKLADPSTV